MSGRTPPLVRPASTTVAITTVTVVGGTLVINGAPVGAANFEVTNLNAAGAGSFAQAVLDANAAGGADTITFADGLTGTINLDATAVITDDLTITGPGTAVITITNAGGDILYVYNSADASVSGITLDGAGDNAIGAYDAADLTMTDVVISDSSNAGLRVRRSGEITIMSSTVTGGDSEGVDVGYVTNLSITESTIADNDGRGVGARYAGDVSLDDSTVEGNDGNGVEVENSTSVDITDSTIESNDGDGAQVTDVPDVTVTDSVLSGNQEGLYAQNLDTFSMTGGEVAANDYQGARIRSVTGQTTIEGAVIFANDGTGMYLSDLGDVSITNTLAGANRFAGIAIQNPDDVTLDNVVSEDNRSAGVRMYDPASVTASDVTITDSGRRGFSIYDATGNVSFDDVVVAGSGREGLSFRDIGGTVDITDTTIDDSLGDGINMYGVTGAITVEGSTISRNQESGVLLRNAAGGTTFTNSTISENGAAGTGGMIDLYNSDATFEHSTISGNTDSVEPPPPPPATPLTGGSRAIELDQSDLTLDHTIVSDNDGMDSVFVGPGSSVVSADYSVVTPGSGFGGTSIESDDPGLTPLRDNGGPTETMQPARGSLVLEAGDPAIATPPATDQRGEARVVGVIDIGAVEGAEASAIDSIEPARFVDTRPGQTTIDGMFEGEGKRAADSEYTVQIAGRGMVPADAVGVVANVTAIAADGTGFVTVHPCVTPRPTASSLNYTASVNLGNEIIAGLNAAGEACFYTSESAHLTVDVVGFVSADSPTMPVTPARLMDTRPGEQTVDGLNAGLGIRPAGSTTNLRVSDRGGVPSDAEAVIVNVTAIGPTTNGFVTVHPCLPTLPTAASLNFTAGVNRGNELIASVSDSGEICLYTSAEVHLSVDVVGYVPAGTNLAAVDPARLVDTRPGEMTIDGQNEGGGPRPADSELTVAVAGRAGVPAEATAAIINVTAIGAADVGFVTVHPCVTPRPNASSLNYVAGVNGGNEIIAQLDATGSVCVYTSASTNLAIDVVGYLL